MPVTETNAGAAASPAAVPAADTVLNTVNPPDKHIWGIYIALCALSIIELYSASSREIAAFGIYYPLIRHVAQLAIGLLIILALQRVHYRWFIPLTPVFVMLSVGMMIYVLLFGEVINGARRAFSLPFISVQPSEFIKLSAVLMCALVLSRTQLKKSAGIRNKGIVTVAVGILCFGALLFNQGLTNTILLMAISVSMMLIGYIEWKKLGLVLLIYACVGGGALAVKLLHKSDKETVTTEQVSAAAATGMQKETDRSGVWTDRLGTFFDSIPPYQRKITSDNRQEMFSYMAQAHGGLGRRHARQLPRDLATAAGILRLHLRHHRGGLGISRRRRRHDPVPVAAGPRRQHSPTVLAGVSGLPCHRHGSDDHVPGTVSHGHRHRRVSGIGSALAAILQSRHLDPDHLDSVRHNAECEPVRRAQRQTSGNQGGGKRASREHPRRQSGTVLINSLS